MLKRFGDAAVEIDCTFAPGPDALQASLGRVRAEAEHAVRPGRTIWSSPTGRRRPRRHPDDPRRRAVHSWLPVKGLRTFACSTCGRGMPYDPHYFAVLIGVGATTVNAYLAKVDRRARGERADPRDLTRGVNRYRSAIDDGLLKIMSKMGIA